MVRYRTTGAAIAAAVLTLLGSAAAAKTWTNWGPPVSAESLNTETEVNTAFNDGCPIISPYDGSLYMASNRPGSIEKPDGTRSLDIWIAPRSGDGWGAPVNAGPVINTSADEFCPTPARGNRFFFVRRLSSTNTDIYVVKKLPHGRWGIPERLPTTGTDPINSPAEEWSPSVFETNDGREVLYFSSTRENPAVAQPRPQNIYFSVNLGPAQFAPGGANSGGSDARPNVRHDGLEMVWDSNRGNTDAPPDIWTATRSSVDQPWGTAVQLPVGTNAINTAFSESRPSLSWDGTTLVFGSARPGEGPADIYVSKRTKVTGSR